MRRWPTLRTLAGAGALEIADVLLEQLLEAGCVKVDEQFRSGRWWPWQVVWVDLPRLQEALGLPSVADRDARRDASLQVLDEIAAQNETLRASALDLKTGSLNLAQLVGRTELLQALSLWMAEQRSGVRQDFALHARPHTKAITETEWRWLDGAVGLASMGIERFAPLLWLSGSMTMRTAQGLSAMEPWPFVGLPVEALDGLVQVQNAPELYWVIENRASFERQARRRESGHCVLWVPGRPSGAWAAAVRRLLTHAPRPARVSADADPAGIEIALTVGAIWNGQGLTWSSHAMEPTRLQGGKTLPLNAYDGASLQRTLASEHTPAGLRDLALAIVKLGRKAEQEGWL